MIDRDLADRVRRAAQTFPSVTITGPRQSGKSTLSRALFPKRAYASLEAPDLGDFARSDPRAFLASYPGGAILDEVQRCPGLLSYLQGEIDENPAPGRWILTGSQNLLLLESIAQSLAGRTAVLHLLPLARPEVRRFARHPTTLEETLLTGGFPAIFDREVPPAEWIASYAATYVERDVRTLANIGDLAAFQRFLRLCAGRSGQLLNLSSLGSDAGVSQPTARSWLSILEASFLVFLLPPYQANIGKRLVKRPKLHFYDTGLLCWLLGIRTPEQLAIHPLRGPIFETWVVSEILKQRMNRGEPAGLFFYRDQRGTEADAVVECGGRFLVVEVKAGKTVTAEMLRGTGAAAGLLGGARETAAFLVHGGDARQKRREIQVLPWERLDEVDWVGGREPPSR